MKPKVTYYQVFCDSVHGSDVIDFDSVEDACKEAADWSMTSKCNVVVMSVVETLEFEYRNGKVIKDE